MILAILQARVSSTRLPGKVMLPLLGKPMLFRQIERLRHTKRIDRLLVATSTDKSDDPVSALCADHQIHCYRGSLDDVLDRFYQASSNQKADYVVRLTGDCPLGDPAIIDQAISLCLQNNDDYLSNALHPTYPDGLDVEVIRWTALQTAWQEARKPSEREHVTPFVYLHPERFKIGELRSPVNYSSYRWTVDEPADFEFVSRVYEALYAQNNKFTMNDILNLLDVHPELTSLNSGIIRNEGYIKSLNQDATAGEK